jgi:hypothetical protein
MSYDSFIAFADDCQKFNKKGYIITDSWVDAEKFQHPNVVVYSRPELLSFTTITDDIKLINKRNKLYNAFIHRVESVRQSWFYFLWLNNLLERGHVSFMLYRHDTLLTGKDLFDQIHNTHLSSLDKFNQAYKNLRDIVPYRNFVNKNDLSEYILDSKYSLVLDSYAPEDDAGAYYISEKVTRALQYPNVNLLFLQKNTLEKLRCAGFYIDPVMLEIDRHGWVERQQKILEILNNDPLDVTDQELCCQARHNRNILSTWLLQCTTKGFFDDIFEKILSD